jgi:hypothetical protein
MMSSNGHGLPPGSGLPESRLNLLGQILGVVLEEFYKTLREEVIVENVDQCHVAATLIFKFERFPGDPTPFTGLASIPEQPEVALHLVEKAAADMRGMIEGEGLGED